MKCLSQTWKQKKSVKTTKSNDKLSPTDKSTKDFQGTPVVKTIQTAALQEAKKTESHNDGIPTRNGLLFNSPTSSLSLSFDFDAAALSEMDRLEQEHAPSFTITPIPHKRRLTESPSTTTSQNANQQQTTRPLTTTPGRYMLPKKNNYNTLKTPDTSTSHKHRLTDNHSKLTLQNDTNHQQTTRPLATTPGEYMLSNKNDYYTLKTPINTNTSHEHRLRDCPSGTTLQVHTNLCKTTTTSAMTATICGSGLFSIRSDSNTPKALSVASNRARQGRKRISTPIEENSNTLVSPSANLPVFSPMNMNCSVSENIQVVKRRQNDEGELSNKNSRLSESESSGGSTHDSSSSTSSIQEVCAASASDVLDLASWGLPPSVLQRYHDMGITHMFDWQAECLQTGDVLKGGNLVYSAPTSAGKTMVAELLMLKRVLETKRKALFILPYVSVSREKMFYLQRLFQEASIRVEGFMGSHSPAGGIAAVDIAVCTIEKANSLLNRLMEENKVSTLGVVVVDEMHMIGDPFRGYLLELFLTKIRFLTANEKEQCEQAAEVVKNDFKSVSESPIQVVCMSATLPNLDMLAHWLGADLYLTEHRPVPLTEMVKIGPTIYDKKMNKIRDIDSTKTVVNDDDHVIPLCKETITQGHSVLIFCPTKHWCEKQAEAIARHFSTIGNPGLAKKNKSRSGFVKASDLLAFDYEAIREVFEQLKRTPVGLDSVLRKVLPYGVAYHHAGLTVDERDIIEGAFRQGAIRVLVATSTLCSGVNLPARRVIIRTPTFHGKMVDPLVYKQMAGRAGRKGIDDLGESVLVCKTTERHKATTLMKAELKPVKSCLLLKEINGGIKRALLEVIVSGVVTGLHDVERYAACTFYASSSQEIYSDGNNCAITETIKFLVDKEFIRIQTTEEKGENGGSDKSPQERYVPTQLGSATVGSALSPDEALIVFGDLQQARKCFVLESELHIIYQVTPIYVEAQWPNLDWNQFLRIWERLPSHMRRVADIVGIQEVYLSLAARGRIPTRTSQQRQQLRVHRRFFAALALQDLVHEVPLNVVAQRYGVTRGMVQSLQSSASTFAGMVTVFCQKLGWVNLDLLLSQFQSRLSFGVERELCDLVRISVLNAARARMLYNAGFQTIASLASAKPEVIETVLRNASPFVSERKHHGETDLEVKHRSEARVIFVAGKKGLNEREAALLIATEAKENLQNDVAQLGIQWKAPELNIPNVHAAEVHGNSNGPGSIQDQTTPIPDDTSCGKNASEKKRRFSKRRKPSGTNRMSPPLSRSPRRSAKNNTPEINCVKGSTAKSALSFLCLDEQKTRVKQDVVEQKAPAKECGPGISKEKCNATVISRKKPSKSHVESQRNGIYQALKAQSLNPGPGRQDSNYSGNVTAVVNSPTTAQSKKDYVELLPIEKNLASSKRVGSSKAFDSDIVPNTSDKHRITRDKAHDRASTGSTCAQPFANHIKARTGTCLAIETTVSDHQNSMEKPYDYTEHHHISNNDRRHLSKRDQVDWMDLSEDCTRKSMLTKISVLCANKNQQEDIQSVGGLISSSERNQIQDDLQGKLNHKDRDKKGVQRNYIVPKDVFCAPAVKSPTEQRTSPRNNDKPHNEPACLSSMKRRSPKNESSSDPPKEKIPRINSKVSDRPFSVDSQLNATQPFSAQDESSAVLFDNSMDVFENKATSVQSISPELYSEPLAEERDDAPGNEHEYQALGFSMTDSYLAQCGGMTQTTSADHCGQPNVRNGNIDNHPKQFDVTSSISDDIMVQHCETISYEIRGKTQVEGAVEMNDKGDRRKNPQIKQNERKISMAPREAVITDCIMGECDSDAHFQAETCKSATCIPVKTCALASSRPEKFREEEDEVLSDQTGSFSLNLSLSGSPLEENCVMDSKTVSYPNIRGEDLTSHESVLPGNCKLQENANCPQSALDRHYRSIAKDIDLNKKSESNGKLILDREHQAKAVFGSTRSSNEAKSILDRGHCLSSDRCDLDRAQNTVDEGNYTEIKDKVTNPKNSRTSVFVLDALDILPPPPIGDSPDSNQSPPAGNTPLSPSGTFSTVNIVNISANKLLFHHFINEWKSRKEFSFAIASERVLTNVPKIGGRFNKELQKEVTSKGLGIEGEDEAVVGIAVCWGGRDAYYISLKDCNDVRTSADESLVASTLSVATRIEGVKSVLEYKGKRMGTKLCFDSAAHYKALAQSCGVTLFGDVEDPKVAAWLLDPSSKEKSLHCLVGQYINDKADLLEGIGAGFGCGSFGLTSQSFIAGRARACTEAVLAYWLMKELRNELRRVELDKSFYQVEMPVMKCLARLELNGIGFSEVECERLRSILQDKLGALEKTAYKLANRSFSLSSPDDIATVLFLELKLPVDGKLEENGATQIKRQTLGSSRRAPRGKRQLKHLSTNKDVLEKLKQFHPLLGVILEWRRVNCALTKVVYPVQREKMFNPRLNMSRIYTTTQIHTATGRVSFAEPNLQNVPRDFEMELPQDQRMDHVTNNILVSMRHTFVPFEGGVMLAADYSQLELRLIAHLSTDQRLLRLLNKGGDVFKMIAGSLNGVEPTAVSNAQRQQAKQICYGIIYGIGAKSLGEQLKLSEDDAFIFIEKFKSRFIGIRKYLKSTVENCRKDGFVLTVTKRRRYLPGINSTNVHVRNQAERQAVNTTVQGSAADLVKIAMINIDRKLSQMYSTTRTTHRHKTIDQYTFEATARRSIRISAQTPRKKASVQSTTGAFVVLQLHDELILEVSEGDLHQVAAMIKKEMETAMKLSVVLPVKLKAGPSWGAMAPFEP